jgi:N-acetylglucosaminyldiphosphoundecaprenol N-acetyl-beta-D-mannosaminyltransferase
MAAEAVGTAIPSRVSLFGLSIDNLTMDETLDRVEAFVAAGSVHQHVAINVDKIVKSHRDPELRAIINACDLASPDGQPVVWASRLLGHPLKGRVAGIDLMIGLFARAEEHGHRIYLLGARPDVVRDVVDRLHRDHPALVVAGARDGYWDPSDEEAVAAEIEAAHPDLLFVAIPSPRKEQFLSAWKARIRAPFVMGVGGSFDVYAGRISRAPAWMRRIGLEWLFRMAKEPRKMWRRYLIDDLAFAPILLQELRTRRRRRRRTSVASEGRPGRPGSR